MPCFHRTETYENGVLSVTETPYTPGEEAAADAAANADLLRQRAATALANNAAFLALPTLTNAQIVAQVKALTRQNNALIRLVMNQLDSTDGTI